MVPGKPGQQDHAHIPILTGLHADTPARTKAGGFMGSAAAFLACQFCWFSGNKFPECGGATLFRGYATPQTMRCGLLEGEQLQIGVNDADRCISHEEQVSRAELMEEDNGKPESELLPAKFGCHGWCPFLKQLPYLDYNDFFLLPWYHATYLGLVKDFWKLVTGARTKQTTYVISASTDTGIAAGREKEGVLCMMRRLEGSGSFGKSIVVLLLTHIDIQQS